MIAAGTRGPSPPGRSPTRLLLMLMDSALLIVMAEVVVWVVLWL